MTQTATADAVGKAAARAPGSCGELAQGMLDGDYFLVTCPIDMYADAQVELTQGVGGIDAPADAPKSRRAVALTLAHFGYGDMGARLRLRSPLPRGKGMASSTADVSAAIAATAAALGSTAAMTPALIAQIALQVEPSDGVMLPHIAVFDHKRGRLAQSLGPPPPMRVVALDFGGGVDTLAFNGVNRDEALKRLQPELAAALALIRRGIRGGSAADVGKGATVSAIANQRILRKPQLDAALRLAKRVGAVGVNAAHSGTMLGVLLPDDAERAAWTAQRARETLSGVRRIYNRRIVSGGVTTQAV